MKVLHGAASASVSIAIERCLELLVAVERYPDWYPQVVRRVAVVETGADGLARHAEASLHVAHGPLVKDFELLLAVEVEPPGAVTLTRVVRAGAGAEERFEVRWRLREADGTVIALELEAELPVPRMLPVGGIGDAIAGGFVNAAVATLQSHAAP
jgi:Polyketide cyclase / dehydrase and lipid transport